MPGFSICFLILNIWQGSEYASAIKYARFLNMPWYSYDNIIIIVINVIVLEFLSAWFVHTAAPQLSILSFFITS